MNSFRCSAKVSRTDVVRRDSASSPGSVSRIAGTSFSPVLLFRVHGLIYHRSKLRSRVKRTFFTSEVPVLPKDRKNLCHVLSWSAGGNEKPAISNLFLFSIQNKDGYVFHALSNPWRFVR